MDDQAIRQAARDAFLDAVSIIEAESKEELRRTVRSDGELDELLLQAVLGPGYLETHSSAPERVLQWFRSKSPEEQADMGRNWLHGRS